MSTADKLERPAARCARRRGSAGERSGSSSSTRAASCPRASGSTSSSTRTRFTELDAFVTHRATDFGLDEERYLGDGVVTGYGRDRRAAGLRLQPGLHRLRRLAVGGARREDLQGDGPGDRERRADHRPLGFRRRADPGGRRQPRRLRRHLPAQHPGVRRRAADLAGHGTVRRRRGLLAGDHRLRRHGRWHQLHVRHRAERGEDGDPRGDRLRGPRRRARPQRDERRRALPRAGRAAGARRWRAR